MSYTKVPTRKSQVHSNRYNVTSESYITVAHSVYPDYITIAEETIHLPTLISALNQHSDDFIIHCDPIPSKRGQRVPG